MAGLERFAARLVLLIGWRRYLAAFLAGLLTALALAPFNLFFVPFLTLPVFVWILDGVYADGKKGFFAALSSPFLSGWWFGFGYFLAGLWWIGNAFIVEAEDFLWLLPIAVLLLPAGLAVFWGAAAVLARLIWSDHWTRCLALAFSLGLFEYLRGTLLTGLPWNAIGYAAMPFTVSMQSSAMMGLYGVTLVAIAVFSIPLVALATPETFRLSKRLPVTLALTICIAHIGFGAFRLTTNPTGLTEINLRLMQPGIDQRDKFDPAREKQIIDQYLSLSAADGLAGANYLIWPESAFPFLLTERRDVLASIGNLLPDGTRLVTGAMRAEPGIAGNPYGKVYNSVLLIDDDGSIIDAADKTHLVPFGEFLPFQESLEAVGLEQLTRLRGGFEPGSSRRLLATESDHPFLPLVCYEIVFPGQVRHGSDTSAPQDVEPAWIVNLTNDAWFGFTPGPYQHLHQALVRGVEEGLPVVRVANTGISAASDAYGRVLHEIGLGRKGVIDLKLPVGAGQTIFARLGNNVFFALLALALFGALSGRIANRRMRES